MALRFVGTTTDPALMTLPWQTPLEEWGDDVLVALPRGLSRHVVRIVRAGDRVLAVKETREHMAFREYRMLRELRRLGLPVVEPVGVVAGREGLEPAFVTVHLRHSLPYRALFSHGLPTSSLPKIIDALVVLLVRLHLAGFFWGDVSLSNVLFRRSAGEFAAYLVDAETGERHTTLSEGQRTYDLEVADGNLFGEMLDLQAGGVLDESVDAHEILSLVRQRYDALWEELTAPEEFGSDEMWRIERRIERLNDLGFDVDEVEIGAVEEASRVRMVPRVVEAGHHRRELQGLTGLDVEENQARRLLNDMAAFTAHYDLGREDRGVVAHRWLTEAFEPIWAMVPKEFKGKLEPAEVFHEILEHRWLLSERAGQQVRLFECAQDYIDTVLSRRPDEAISPAP